MKSLLRVLAAAALAFSLDARAQLISIDGGLVVEDADSMMFANILSPVGFAGGSYGDASSWANALNSKAYGGYSDWSIVTADASVPGNNTTNQLGYLLLSDCSTGCTAFTALQPLLNNPAGGVLVSSTNGPQVGPRGCPIIFCGFDYAAYLIGFGGVQGTNSYNNDQTWNGQAGGYAIAERAVKAAPELDPSRGLAALALLGGAALVMKGRRQVHKIS